MSLVEFEKWFEGNESKFEYPRLAHKSAKQAWNYQQGEVDKLKTEIDELQARIDEVLIEMKNQLGDEDFCDMQRPDYDAMLYALINIKDILKGNKYD